MSIKVFFIMTIAVVLAQEIIAPALHAETVYKGRDASGNPSFSDTPSPNSQRIEINPIPTYTPPPLSPNNSQTQSETNQIEKVTEYKISILKPANEQTFTTDTQHIEVALTINPALHPEDKIQYYLNGQPYGELTTSSTLGLDHLDRGSYLVKADILDAKGTMKAQSNTITFYQQRTSILNPNHPANRP